jgi:hypothetical protein
MLFFSCPSNILMNFYYWYRNLWVDKAVDLFTLTCRIVAVLRHIVASNVLIQGETEVLRQGSVSPAQNRANVRRSEPSQTRCLLRLTAALTRYSGVTRP